MSLRMNRQLAYAHSSPSPICEDRKKCEKIKKNKGVRKIRKTNDFVCLNFTLEEYKNKCNVGHKTRKTATENDQNVGTKINLSTLPSPDIQSKIVKLIPKTNDLIDLNYSHDGKIQNRKLKDRTGLKEDSRGNENGGNNENSAVNKSILSLEVNNGENPSVTDISSSLTRSHEITQNLTKRKIKKGLRRLRLASPQKETENLKPAKESPKYENLEAHLAMPHPSCKEVNVDPESNLAVTSDLMPSPISPSTSSSDNCDNPFLHFNSSKENLCPSNSGVVKSTKRRTYELEDSIIDLSVLKSESKRDSLRITAESDDSGEIQVSHSKVTMRRRWNKSSVTPKKSPAWISSALKSQVKLEVSPFVPKTTPSMQRFASNVKKVANFSPFVPKKTPSFTSKVKIPNFAAIHQKALNKMEDITEYKQRKEDRAKMLLSGRKPVNSAPRSHKTSKKELRFAPDTSLKIKSPTFIPLPSTPLPKNAKLFRVSESPATPISLARKRMETNIFNFCNRNKVTKLPTFQKIPVLVRPKPVIRSHAIEKKATHMVQIKSIATKTKPVKNALESRRCEIKGVRSNRRFELLMNMRKGK